MLFVTEVASALRFPKIAKVQTLQPRQSLCILLDEGIYDVPPDWYSAAPMSATVIARFSSGREKLMMTRKTPSCHKTLRLKEP